MRVSVFTAFSRAEGVDAHAVLNRQYSAGLQGLCKATSQWGNEIPWNFPRGVQTPSLLKDAAVKNATGLGAGKGSVLGANSWRPPPGTDSTSRTSVLQLPSFLLTLQPEHSSNHVTQHLVASKLCTVLSDIRKHSKNLVKCWRNLPELPTLPPSTFLTHYLFSWCWVEEDG